MSPLFADRFSGHMPLGDPRGPLSVAGGCIWPTVPAFRYLIVSDDATEELEFFNSDPALIEFTGSQPAHSFGRWTLVGPNDYVDSIIADKRHWPGELTYAWSFVINVTEFPGHPLIFRVVRPVEKCNRDIPLPNVVAFDPDSGETGDTFRMEQVEWDQAMPPA